MRKDTIKKIHLPVLAISFLLISSPGLSQQESDAPKPVNHSKGPLEEVMVTATRRVESAQDVAVSITVFNQEQIANANMTNSNDIATYTPSLTTNTRFGPENASFSIRGFNRALRTAASVGVYFAEVIAPRGQSIQTSGDGAGPGTLFDLQNMQVLKGPQGTLFGRNTTGGSILLVPNRPGDDFEGYVEYSGGNYNSERVQAVVNIPVSDNFKLRFGVDDSKRDGHLNNISGIGADKLGNVDYTAVRLSILQNINDNLENYTIVSAMNSDTNGYTADLFACNPDGASLVAGALPPTLLGLIQLLYPDFDPLAFDPIAQPIDGPCGDQLAREKADGLDGFYDVMSTIKSPKTVIKERRLINTTSWFIDEDTTLKGILAWADLYTENGSDVFGSQFTNPDNPNLEFTAGVSAAYPDYPVTDQSTWVAELQLQGTSLESRLEWQTGLYYETSLPNGPSGQIAAVMITCNLLTLESNNPADYQCYDPTAGFLGSVLRQDIETTYINKAVYAQTTYDFSEMFSLTTGLRYTWDYTRAEAKKFRWAYFNNNQLPYTVQETEPSQSSEAPTGVIELQFRPLDSVMMYAKYLRGYRQGGVNPAADPGIDVFDKEEVDTYEIGAKTEFGGPIPGRFNLAVFDNDFRDMQLQTGYISTLAGSTTAIFNAGKSKIKGIEAEVYLQPLDSLRLSISYSYLDTELLEQKDNRQKITEEVNLIAGSFATPIADVGDELPNAPDESWVVNLGYTLPTPIDWGNIEIGTTYVYTGEQRVCATSTGPFCLLPAYELWNYNASWMGILGSGFDLSFFVTNAKDEEYVTYVSGSFNTLRYESRMTGLPKMYGARLRYNF